MKRILFASAVTLATGLAWGACAQDGSVALGEIVVTAEHTATNLQRTAVAISAVGQADLQRAGITDISRLTQLVPALTAVQANGPYNTYSMRGMGGQLLNSYVEPSVVMSLDGVVLGHPTAAHGMFYDLERVEVLKGPQGTLYGRNATGGAINVISARPILGEQTGEISVEAGNYDHLLATGAANVPVTDTVALRAAFQSARRDGFYNDGLSDLDVNAVRGSLLWEPSDDLSVVLRADYAHIGGKGPGNTIIAARDSSSFPYGAWTGAASVPCAFLATGACASFAPLGGYTLRNVVGPPTSQFMNNDYWGFMAEVNWDTPLGALTVLPAYRENTIDYLSSVSGFWVRSEDQPRQYSLETRLAGGEETPLRYVLGLFYFKDEQDSHSQFQSVAAAFPLAVIVPTLVSVNDQHVKQDTTTWAGFGQLTWSATDTLRIVGGLRYSYEKKTLDGLLQVINHYLPPAPAGAPRPGTQTFVNRSKDWTSTTYKVGFEWDARPDSLVYGNVSTGFKAGGFFFGNDIIGFTYDPEEVTAYTLGSKNRFFDDRLQVNAEAFYYKYKDQQVAHLVSTTRGIVFVQENVGDATMKGVELSVDYLLTANTRLSFEGQWLDAAYDSLVYQVPNLGTVPTPTAASPGQQTCPFMPSNNPLAAPGANGANNAWTLNCSGRRALYSPEVTLRIGLEQTFPLASGAAIVAAADVRYSSDRESLLSYAAAGHLDAYTMANAEISYRSADDRWSVALWGANLTDEEVPQAANLGYSHASGPFTATLMAPRTYGVRLKAKFGPGG